MRKWIFCIGLLVSLLVGAMASAIEAPVPPPRYAKTSVKGVNMRERPNGKASIVRKIPITGTLLEILEEHGDVESGQWYAVRLDADEGFIRSDLLEELDEEAYAKLINAQDKPVQRKPTLGASTAGAVSSHAVPPASTAVWTTTDGRFHSATACDHCVDGEQTTLGAAQQRGLSPCNLCWCYECLYGEE